MGPWHRGEEPLLWGLSCGLLVLISESFCASLQIIGTDLALQKFLFRVW